MAARKPFLLRLDERTFIALKRWADEDLRSINSQVEYLLRRSLEQAGRLSSRTPEPGSGVPDGEPGSEPT